MQDIKKEYETTKTTFKALGLKHGVHYKTLERRAKKEEWVKYRPTEIEPQPTLNPTTIPPSIETKITEMEESIKSFLSVEEQPLNEILLQTYLDSYRAFMELREEVKKEGRFSLSPKGSQYINPKYSALQMEKMNLIKIGKEMDNTFSTQIKFANLPIIDMTYS